MWEVETRTLVIRGMLEAVGRQTQYPNDRLLLPMWVAEHGLRPKLPSSSSPECCRNCPAGWVELMENCWKAKPLERPRFPEIVTALQRMLTAAMQQRRQRKPAQPQRRPELQPQPQKPRPRVPQAPAAGPEQQQPLPLPRSAPSSNPGDIRAKLWPHQVWQAILAFFARLYRFAWFRLRALLPGHR